MNVFELFAKISVDTDEYEAGLNDAEKAAYQTGEKIGGGLKSGAAIAGKAIAATATAAATGVVALTKGAASAYAEAEQLQGGIETLFGASGQSLEEYMATTKGTAAEYQSLIAAQEAVMQNAANAYSTAGMSANEYMNTVIGMAGALNKATGDTEESARLADMAITDMSDNVNKMGTSMEMVQNAYTGFSRGNFTMLDNLALGFAGTKEGMQELLDQAEAISGVEYDIESYADIVQAIHAVQDEMGIVGTTTDEAMGTISGSLAMTKAAWDNLVTALGSGEGLDTALDNLVTSAEATLTNIMPVVERSLVGIADLIAKLAPVIAEKLPFLMDEILPPLIEATTSLLQGLIEALPTILQILIEALPSIIDTVINTIVELLPLIVELGLQLILALAEGLIEALPELIPAIVEVIMQIVTLLTEPDTLVKLIEVAFQLIGALSMGIIQAIPELIKALPEIILNLVQFFFEAGPQLIASGLELIMNLITGFLSATSEIWEAVLEIKDTFADKFHEMIDDALEWGRDLITGFIDGIKEKWSDLKETVKGMAQTVKDYIGFSEPKSGPLSNFHTYAPDMMNLFMQGIKDNEGKLQNTLNSALNIGDVPTSDIMSVSPVSGSSGVKSIGGSLGGGQHTVILELDKVQLGKVIYTLNNQETQRMGVNLAGGLA